MAAPCPSGLHAAMVLALAFPQQGRFTMVPCLLLKQVVRIEQDASYPRMMWIGSGLVANPSHKNALTVPVEAGRFMSRIFNE